MGPGELKKQIDSTRSRLLKERAAPELYEALKEVSEMFVSEALSDSVLKALAKAEGKDMLTEIDKGE